MRYKYIAGAIAMLVGMVTAPMTLAGSIEISTGSNGIGQPDPNFQLVLPSGSPATPVGLSSIWVSARPGSNWIGPEGGNTSVGAPGIYKYTFTFPIDCPARASIEGVWASDDGIAAYLNGVSIFSHPNPAPAYPPTGNLGGNASNYQQLHSFSANGSPPFQFGENTLDVFVENGGGPTGLYMVFSIIDPPCPCVLDFADVEVNYNGYPDYFNEDGFHKHSVLDNWTSVVVSRFLSCYEYMSYKACQSAIGTTKHIWYPIPDGQDAEVTSAHWFYDAMSCKELKGLGILPPDVRLLATGVDLIATKNDSGVDLTLTTDSEKETAALAILRGEKLENGGTAIDTVCGFATGSSPYTCTDDVIGDNYRALEIEDNGDLIVYDEVTPK